jgi:ribosome biogenesis GTPase
MGTKRQSQAIAVDRDHDGQPETGRLIGRVLRAQSGFFRVETDQGILMCTLRGRLKKERQSTDIAVIGDLVEVTPTMPGHGVIEAVLPRRTKLGATRTSFERGLEGRCAGGEHRTGAARRLSCASPEFSPRMLDRYLVLIETSDLDAVIVANKVDLVGEAEAHRLFAPYERLEYPVIYTSAVTGYGIDALRARLEGRISVVTGRSGVGKSSLFNAVQPGLGLAVGAISTALNKGRHTTRVAELIPLDLPGGGYLADTPGIRELGLWRFPKDELARCFREFRPYLGDCYFAGCTHIHEPDCAVRAALARGEITPERYDSYVRLFEGE